MDPDITTQVNVKKNTFFYYCCQVCCISIDLLFLLLFYVLQTGISPLHLSAKEGHVELCEHLVENGAMPGLTTNVRHKLLYCYYFFYIFKQNQGKGEGISHSILDKSCRASLFPSSENFYF